MRPEETCEVCGRPERGYSALDANVRGARLRKGGARLPVESFVCSTCTQRMLRKGSNQALAARKEEM
jgi:hypothetical protein